MTQRVDLQFLSRDVRIYFPLRDEYPVDLLVQGGLAEEDHPDLSQKPFLRVAKCRGEVVGVYYSRVITPTRHQMESLAVNPPWRGRGIGSWLVGHALGVSESRGAKELAARANTSADGLFQRLHFVRVYDNWQMNIDPE